MAEIKRNWEVTQEKKREGDDGAEAHPYPWRVRSAGGRRRSGRLPHLPSLNRTEHRVIMASGVGFS